MSEEKLVARESQLERIGTAFYTSFMGIKSVSIPSLLSQVSPFTIQPSAEELPPLGTCSVSVQYTSSLCQRLHTVLELEVENGERR